MRTRRRFGIEFKRKVVQEIQTGVLSAAQAIREYELSSNLIYRWMDDCDHGKLENEPTQTGALENKIASLERKIGQQAMEIELLKKARTHYQERLNEKSFAPSLKAAPNGGVK